MKKLLILALLSVGLVLAGCGEKPAADAGAKVGDVAGKAGDMAGKAGETAKDAGAKAGEMKDMAAGAMDAMKNMDFSSPEKITATVIPAVKDMLAKNEKLKDLKLDVVLKDKVMSVTGDVQNNDQKRAIDDTLKPLMEQMKANGLNFLNGAVVKG
jgi:outer membrane murein-binding lipoprotein Lpp